MGSANFTDIREIHIIPTSTGKTTDNLYVLVKLNLLYFCRRNFCGGYKLLILYLSLYFKDNPVKTAGKTKFCLSIHTSKVHKFDLLK